MAIDDLDEHEQGERVRAWLRNNGGMLLGGVCLGLIVISGWQWFGRHQRAQDQQSYQAYVDARTNLDKATEAATAEKPADLKAAQAEVAKLAKDNALYGELAALQVAKAQVEAGKTEDAITTLKSIKPSAEFKQVVNLRLARLLADAGKTDEASKLLAGAEDADSLVVRADLLASAGKNDEAKALYLKALTTIDVASPQRRLVEMKLAEVGGTAPKPTEAT